MKAILRDDDLTIEEAETLLDDKYKAMKEVQGWTEEVDELALFVVKTLQENIQRTMWILWQIWTQSS